ncbi:MAG: 2-isopropylmalate synthase [Candidatus Latescibacteria bacterium]|nr:2-isopropylmalate synthase [Candidatus Latescibacterota bacterium]
MSGQDRVTVFDTTLRDAEQTPGASLTVGEKMEIAHQLARLRVDVIEAGFPISSNEDFEAVRRIGQEVEGPIICGLARAVSGDIDRAGEALRDAPKPRIHTFVGTSNIHLQGQLRKGKEEVLKMAVQAVERAKSFCDDVEFSPMDAARTDPDYLREVITATIAAGATTINIPDTVGYAVPEQFGALIARILAEVENVDQAVISVHCHDDLGMAVSNTLAALKLGARQAECTLNGLGERAGNASLEEVVMALATRGDYFGLETGVVQREIIPTSRLVSRLMGIGVPPNKAVVGANAFAHSSGIHQDGVLKQRSTFEIMAPQDVGLDDTEIVLTARSGRHALRHRLEVLGYEMDQAKLDQIYEAFLELADKKKDIYDEDLVAIIGGGSRDLPEHYRLEYLHTVSGTGTVPSATVRLCVGDQTVQHAAWGDGPVDATYNALGLAADIAVKVDEYAISALTGGSQAQGEVTVQLSDGGEPIKGRGVSTDIVEASAKAFVDALNRLAARSERGKLPTDSV